MKYSIFLMRRWLAAIIGVVLVPVILQAQSFNPETDDGFTPLLVAGTPARWFDDSATVLRSLNGSDNTTLIGYSQAFDNSVASWNNALAAKGIDFTLSIEDWTPVLPDTFGTDPVNDPPLVGALNGTDTCMFKAYNTDGNYVCYVYNSSGVVTGERPDGHPDCSEDITRLCSLYVGWEITGPANDPTSVQPVRDANGFIQSLGNGKNEIFFEEQNYSAAIEDFAADPESTLALTVTRALVGGFNYAEIVEADILFNGNLIRIYNDSCPFGCEETPGWSTDAISGLSAHCDVPGESSADNGSVPATAGGARLCYVASTLYEYQYDIQNILTHELGHFLGFGHPCDDLPLSQQSDCRHDGEDPRTALSAALDPLSETTMFWIAYDRQSTKRSLEPNDIAGLLKVFGEIIATDGASISSSSGGCSASGGMPLLPLMLTIALACFFRMRKPVRVPVCEILCGRSFRKWPFAGLVVAALLSATDTRATSVIPLGTADLVRRADLIVEAVVGESEAKVGAKGAVHTDYELEVKDVLMGLPPAKLVVAVPGGRIGDTEIKISGAPRFVPGDRAFFFLKLLKNRWIVVGLSQGAKPVLKTEDGSLAVDAPRDPKVKAMESARSAGVASGLEEFRAQVRDLVRQLSESK